jgi:ribosomal protein L37AE/L43A
MQKIRSIKMDDHVKPDRELEEYECPECGRDCGQKVKGEVGICWHFYCEYCGIDFGGDL